MKLSHISSTVFLVAATTFVQAQNKEKAMQPKPEPKPAHAEKVYAKADEMPAYEGGFAALQRHVVITYHMPESCVEDSTFKGGKVYLKFIVNRDGTMSDYEVVQNCPGCSEAGSEAIRVMKLAPNKWKPGTIKGEPVSVYQFFPITLSTKKK